MSKGVSNIVTFKPYSQSEVWLLPPSLDELVPKNHPVRIVSSTVDQLNIESIFLKYTKGGGASRYHPAMLMKVLIYGYMKGIYSSRKLAALCREDVNVMWLTGFQQPDFRTINEFRGKKLKDAINEVFIETIKLLYKEGYVQLKNYFVDGTKIESAASRYSFVWKKSVDKYEAKLEEYLREVLKEADKVANEENEKYGDRDLEELGEESKITSEKIKEVAERINQKLQIICEQEIKLKEKIKQEIKKQKAENQKTSRENKNQKVENESNEDESNKNQNGENQNSNVENEKVENETSEQIKEQLQETKELKKTLTKARYMIEKNFLPRKEKYEQYRESLNGRNSFSKTDVDATFMRMKDDHLGTAQPKPAYNVQAATENNFVIGYDIFQNPADMRTFIPLLEKVQEELDCSFQTIIADAGYGSEENYDYLESKNITPLVKYPGQHQESKKSFSKRIDKPENWKFDAEKKQYTCAGGKILHYKETIKKTNASGYEQTVDIYKCDDCDGCPFKEKCTKSENGRTVARNENLIRHKTRVKEVFTDEENRELAKQRSVQCETVFAQTKWNKKFTRFLLRGLEKVKIEWGLLMLGYNFKQLRWC